MAGGEENGRCGCATVRWYVTGFSESANPPVTGLESNEIELRRVRIRRSALRALSEPAVPKPVRTQAAGAAAGSCTALTTDESVNNQ